MTKFIPEDIMTLYADKNGRMVQVHGELTDPVQFCPQGGGFNYKAAKADFLANFTPCEAPGFRAAKFSGEWLNGRRFSGYTNDMRWNGWAMPYLAFEEAERYAALGDDFKLRFDATKDAWIAGEGDEEEVFEAQTIVVDGKEIKVYPVGAGSWTWEFADELPHDLAAKFAMILREQLSAEEMQQIVERNHAETNASVCHSHDFCDANMVMDAAFTELGLATFDGDEIPDHITDLWNEAWDIAKASGFATPVEAAHV